MSYKDNLEKNLTLYTQKRDEFQKLTEDSRFDTATVTLPFRFLKARYILDILETYQQTPDAQMTFRTGIEAVQQYKDIEHFAQEKEELLDAASYMQEVITLKNETNELVKGNPYLTNSMMLPGFGKLEEIVKDCLVQIPQYDKLYTDKFRIHFIESCIESLNEKGLTMLLKFNVLKNEDFDKIRLNGSDSYRHNLTYLCGVTGHGKIHTSTIPTRLKGTTFKNEDGTFRQDNLKELAQWVKDNPNEVPEIKAECYEYTPNGGKPEPAVRVTWNGKGIGAIPKDVVQTLYSNGKSPEFEIRFQKIVGGENKLNYGCDIQLDLYTRVYEQEQDKTEKER